MLTLGFKLGVTAVTMKGEIPALSRPQVGACL